MLTMNDVLKNKQKVTVNLKLEYEKELKDKEFFDYIKDIPLSDNKLCKYTSQLKDCFKENNNCKNCHNISMCINEVKGYSLTPIVEDNNISFSYNACKYKQKQLTETAHEKNIQLYNEPTNLKNAKMKDIYLDDKSRINVIKYLNDYIKNYDHKRLKGLYLTGNFGSGKTYLISALFNELAKKNIKSVIIYFPEFLRTLKMSFSSNELDTPSYSEKFEYIKNIPVLLIDDIGAENLTSWARDEILGTILQYRMQENLPTFFTSNLTLDDLETHLSISNGKVDKVKSRRIIERIKYLANEINLIGIDRRK